MRKRLLSLLGICGVLSVGTGWAVNVEVYGINIQGPDTVIRNDDDDDADGTADRLHEPLTVDDNDLGPFTVELVNATPALNGERAYLMVYPSILGGTSEVKIWADRRKTIEHAMRWDITNGALVVTDDAPTTFYVEGVQNGTGSDDFIRLRTHISGSGAYDIHSLWVVEVRRIVMDKRALERTWSSAVQDPGPGALMSGLNGGDMVSWELIGFDPGETYTWSSSWNNTHFYLGPDGPGLSEWQISDGMPAAPYSLEWGSPNVGVGSYAYDVFCDVRLGVNSSILVAFSQEIEGYNDDLDGDGLTYDDEVAAETSHLDPDSDDDGLNDLEEVNSGSNPLLLDSDFDGIADGDELDAQSRLSEVNVSSTGLGTLVFTPLIE